MFRKLIVVFLSFLLSCLTFATSTNLEIISASDIKKISISNNHGSVTIAGTNQQEIKLSITKQKLDKNCSIIKSSSDGVFSLSINSISEFFNNHNCKADLKLEVPYQIDLELNNTMGDITINNTKGNIEVTTVNGNIYINGVINNLLAKTVIGKIKVSGLTGNASINVLNSTVNLIYFEKPVDGQLYIRSVNGDATVFLPKYSKITVSHSTIKGQLLSDFPNSSSKEPFKISMHAINGSLFIKKSTEEKK